MLTPPDASLLAVCTRNRWRGELGGAVATASVDDIFIETRHWGWGLLLDADKTILWQSAHAGTTGTFFRSSAKPFQAAVLLDYGASSVFLPQELAIASGSHSGMNEHLHWVKHILARLQTQDECHLRCGPQHPVDAAAQRELWQSHEQATPLHNNCSGKHAAMLWACEQAGWDKATYWHPEHPLQQRILEIISYYGNVPTQEIAMGLDGCGVPAFYLMLQTIAILYVALVSESTFLPIVEAMLAYPELVSGLERIDWALMTASQGQLLSKVGADGLICVANRKTKQSFVLKLADGNQTIRDHLIVHYLEKLGWLTKDQCLLEACRPFYETVRYNTLRQPVGEIQHCLYPTIC